MPFAIQITNPALEVRGVGPYTGQDIRSMMARSHVCDFRQLGCPDAIFQSILEKRAKRTERSTPAPAQSVNKEWMGLAFQALGQKEVIEADNKRAARAGEMREDPRVAIVLEAGQLLKVLERRSTSVDDALKAERRLAELQSLLRSL